MGLFQRRKNAIASRAYVPLLADGVRPFDQTNGALTGLDGAVNEHGRTQMNRVAEGAAITGIFTGGI